MGDVSKVTTANERCSGDAIAMPPDDVVAGSGRAPAVCTAGERAVAHRRDGSAHWITPAAPIPRRDSLCFLDLCSELPGVGAAEVLRCGTRIPAFYSRARQRFWGPYDTHHPEVH